MKRKNYVKSMYRTVLHRLQNNNFMPGWKMLHVSMWNPIEAGLLCCIVLPENLSSFHGN